VFSSLSSSDKESQSTRDRLISHMYDRPSSSKRVSRRMRRSPANMAWRTLISKSFTPKEAGARKAVRRSSRGEGRSGAGGVIEALARVPKRDTRQSLRAAPEEGSSSSISSRRGGMVSVPARVTTKARASARSLLPWSRRLRGLSREEPQASGGRAHGVTHGRKYAACLQGCLHCRGEKGKP